MSSTLSFFAVLKEDDDEQARSVRRIPVTQSLQRELSEEFEAQRAHFPFPKPAEKDPRPHPNPKRVPFDPGYTPSDDELPYIESYTPPEAFRHALEAPLDVQELETDRETLEQIAGIFTGQSSPRPWLVAQAFDRRRLLSSEGFTLIHRRKEFKRLVDPGLTLDTKVAVRWENRRLEFTSFSVAHRILDLSAYFEEATDVQLTAMAEHEHVLIENVPAFVDQADSWTRRKVSLIAHSGILEVLTPRQIAKAAKPYKVQIPIRRIGGHDRIAFPTEKRALKTVLRFLDEDYFTSELLRIQYYTNSKRRLRATPAGAVLDALKARLPVTAGA